MSHKILTTTILALAFLQFTKAQRSATDSLKALLLKAKEDTNKVNLLRETGISIIYQNPPAAIPYFKDAIVLAKKLDFHPGLERNYAATSTAFAFSAKYDSARIYIDTAISYALKVGDVNRLALVYLNRADAYLNLQDFSAALKNCDTAMKYAEQSGNKDRTGRIYNIISDVYTRQKQYPSALAYLDKAAVLYAELKNAQMTGKAYFNRGLIFRRMKEQEKAISSYQAAIRIADSVNDISNLSAYQGELAGVLVEAQRYDEAAVLANSALKYAEKVGNRPQQAVIHGLFYNLYAARNDFRRAIPSALAAYGILKEEKDLLREQLIASWLADAYSKTENYSEAYKFQKISSDLNDSLLRQQFNKETAQLQTAFQVAQKDKEIQLLNKDKEIQQQSLARQQVLFAAAVIVALLSLGGIGLLVSRYRLRQRMKEMQLRNQIAADLHDEVGSSLSSIHMLSQMAYTKQDTVQKEILSKVSSYTRETMDKMGDIVWMIKPSEHEAVSLKERMERFLYEMCNSRNIASSFNAEGLDDVKLNMQQRKSLYLVFKEAVNNAVKYADPKHLDVEMKLENRSVKLTVRDDGKGFDTGRIRKGNGLDNMKNRARELGGETRIESIPGAGTTIVFSVPA